MFKNSILVAVVLLGQVLLGHADLYAAEWKYSNYVGGNASQKNSEQFLNLVDESFYSYEADEKKFDVEKVRNLQQELRSISSFSILLISPLKSSLLIGINTLIKSRTGGLQAERVRQHAQIFPLLS